MSTIELWDYQKETIGAVRAQFRAGVRRVLLVSPTGSGKTVMFSHMTANHLRSGGRVLILVHRQELTQQVSDALEAQGVQHGFIAAGFPDIQRDVNVASVFTLAKRKLNWTPTLIIVDEAHHCAGGTTWVQVLSRYSEDVAVLGVTATPCRHSGEGLGESFQTMVLGPTPQELIDRGYLSKFSIYCPPAPSMQGVPARMGEFVQKEVAARVDRPSITGDAVRHYRTLADGRQTIGFCLSVEHAHHVADEFKRAGYQAACIDGNMPTEWRRQMVADFKRRELKILTSCSLVDEGFDCPGIECDLDLAPTLSLGRHLQRRGRALRISPGKDEAIFLDAAGNMDRHGPPTEPRVWTLNGKVRSERDDDSAEARFRTCGKCWAYVPATRKKCPKCDTIFPAAKPRKVAKKKGKLEKVTPEELAARRKAQEVGMTNSLSALVELGRIRGYRDPEKWAQHVWAGKQAKKARLRSEDRGWLFEDRRGGFHERD